MMDSGSSGSMQSSSGGGGGCCGGDEEYDSRRESISSLLNHPSSGGGGHFGSISANPPILSHQQNTLFDLHLHNLDTFPQSLPTPNSNVEYNHNNMAWPRGLRSETTSTNSYGNSNFGNFASSSSPSSSRPSQSLFGTAQGMGQASRPPLMEPARASPNLDHQQHRQQQSVVNKNPKKRTRASRRAPTTVLTTDTTNFRQMVQEFTGIPAAPFSGGGSLPFSRRFDLFSGSALRGVGQLDGLGSLYPLRPSAQKPQISPFMAASSSSTASPSLLSSGVINAGGTNNNAIIASIPGASSTINSTTNNFQTPSINLGLQKQPQNIFSMQNQLLTFSPSLKLNPMGNEPFLSSRSQGGMNMNMPSSDELGMSHHQQQQARNDDNNGGQDHHHLQISSSSSFDHGNGGVNAHHQHVSSFKLNHSSSSSADFYPEKVLENASSGGTEFRNFN